MVRGTDDHSRHIVLIRAVAFSLQRGQSEVLAKGPKVVISVAMSVF